MSAFLPVHVVTGDDPSLVSYQTSLLLDKLCGKDRGLFLVEASLETDLLQLLRSVPMFTDFQVVLLQKSIDPGTLQVLLKYLESPEPTTALVISANKIPAELSKTVKKIGGEVVDASPKKPLETVRELVADTNLNIDAGTKQFLASHLGEEIARLPMLLETLVSVYGPDASLGTGEIEPFLGAAGGVPPWDLTDAIDKKDASKALEVLHRMLRSRPPIVVLASVSAHVERLFRLRESNIKNEKEAALFLGMKGSTYPAKKALQVLPAWRDLFDAVSLTADAATDLRGKSPLPDVLVMEILIARLAKRP